MDAPGAGRPDGPAGAPEAGRMLVFHLRTARRKAREAATAEALALLHGLGAAAPVGGPLSEVGGLFWVTVPDDHLAAARARLPRLGYTVAVDLLVPEEHAAELPDGGDLPATRWRRRPYRLLRLYAEDAEAARARAPDRRPFLYETYDGQVREVRGYRGGNDPLSHRALPVGDARLLVNLVAGAGPGTLLDPFAGAGGVVIEARDAGWAVVTADRDHTLRHGLAALGARHTVADARALPLATGSVDAVATEPPYDPAVGDLAEVALAETRRVVRAGGAVAFLVAAWQAPGLRAAAGRLGLSSTLDTPINRKGLDVTALAWRR